MLSDGQHRYPVVEDIPYLRINRDDLIFSVLAALEQGRPRDALYLLLQDQDDWSRSPKPDRQALAGMVEGKLSLRAAMAALNFGPVSDYFAYRWSDPTFLSGLALLETHLPVDANVLELACGIGHYLREFEMRSIPATGGDVVFAKLWLAKHYLTSTTPLVCFDAHAPFPFGSCQFNTAFCHDAFYFLMDKVHVVAELKRVSGRDGVLLIGHTHCAEAANFSAGEPLSIGQYSRLVPNATLYDDKELTASVVEDRSPRPGVQIGCPAIALATNSPQYQYRFKLPEASASLRLNPLFSREGLRPEWPSKRYEEEYSELSTYLDLDALPLAPNEDLVRRRIYVSLPTGW